MGKVHLLRITEEVGATFKTLTEAVGSLTDQHPCRIIGPIVTEAEGGKPGSRWAVVVVQEGTSKNRVHYSAEVLTRAAKLYESAKVFWNHSSDTQRDPRDLAGFIKEASATKLPDGKTAIQGVLVATSAKLREQLIEAHEAGNPDLLGLSHSVIADTERVMLADGPATRAKSIKTVESVDVVSFPSAGGRVMRLAAGSNSPIVETEEGLVMLQEKLKKLKESRPDLFAKLAAEPTEAQVDALLIEALTPVKPEPKKADPTPDGDKSKGLSDADRSLLTEARVNRIMEGRTLPDASKTVIRESLLTMATAGVDEPTLIKHLDAHVLAASKIAEGDPKGSGNDIKITKDEADKIIEGWTGFFNGDTEKGFRSVREAYVLTTGDKHVTGEIGDSKNLRRFNRLLEAIDSTTFANVLASTMNRKLVGDYTAKGGAYSDWGAGWLVDVVPLSDFRQQERTRLGGYGNLSTVPQGTAYPILSSPTDEKATYSPAKKGGVESLTREMIANDDVGAVRRIPRNMAMAARRTLYEFVWDLVIGNTVAIYDAAVLFHAGSHVNLAVSTAFSATAYMAGRVAMQKQAEKNSLKRLGLLPQHLAVPVDLEEAARNAFKRDTNNDAKFAQDSAPMIHTITHTTNAVAWFLMAGTDQVPMVELGFLNGQAEPRIIVADNPAAGNMFSADKMDFRIDHVYGAAIVDYRGFYAGTSAGTLP